MYLGIEIGGTKLQVALGDGAGRILHVQRVRAQPQRGRAGICEQIESLIHTLPEKTGVALENVPGIGVGFGGPVNSTTGCTLKSHQVDGWDNFPIVQWFQDRFQRKVTLGNDSDLAGLAEAHFGAGMGKRLVVYTNIGSGIGGAFVFDGRVFAGQGIGSAEIGHLRVLPREPGQPWATVESVSSGWGMQESARRAADANPGSLLWSLSSGKRDNITSETLVEAVRQKDPTAVEVWKTAVERYGVAIANVITLLDPEVVVVGGGVSLVGDLLFVPLREAIARQSFQPFAGTYQIVPAALGEEVVLHGALKLAADAASTAS